MRTIATIKFGTRRLSQVKDEDLPYAAEMELFWEAQDQDRLLSVTDRFGQTSSYDLGLVPALEASCAALSLRISQRGAFQADCLLGKATIPSPTDFVMGEVLGLRFQPILLPGLAPPSVPAKGQGLFARGLHFPGIVTRSNVSFLCLCDTCRTSFRLQPFHSGFAQTEYYYCGSGLHTLIVDDRSLSQFSNGRVGLQSAQSEVEQVLPHCGSCGNSFLYLNPLKCPHCAASYIDFATYPEMRKAEYYGNLFYGTSAQHLTTATQEP